VLVELRADLGELHVDDVAELALRVVRDPHVDDVTFGRLDVLVLLRVPQVARDVGHSSLRAS
jgi:hypothetical protein